MITAWPRTGTSPEKTSVKEGAENGTDDRLVSRLRTGSESAFREIVELYGPRIYALVSGMISDRSEAEDVVQEVFFKVHRKIQLFEGKSAFYTWLYRIALNTATDHLKRRRHRDAASLEDLPGFDVPAHEGAPELPLDRRELRRHLADAVAELPEIYRDIIVLREYEELSYEEIAATLGCSKGTVESRLFRARARLKDKLTTFLK